MIMMQMITLTLTIVLNQTITEYYMFQQLLTPIVILSRPTRIEYKQIKRASGAADCNVL